MTTIFQKHQCKSSFLVKLNSIICHFTENKTHIAEIFLKDFPRFKDEPFTQTVPNYFFCDLFMLAVREGDILSFGR